MNNTVEIIVDKSVVFVEKSADKCVYNVRSIVKKVFGFIKTNVRFSTFGCSVEKYFTAFPLFGFVRITPDNCTLKHSFTHFPHGLLLLLFI